MIAMSVSQEALKTKKPIICPIHFYYSIKPVFTDYEHDLSSYFSLFPIKQSNMPKQLLDIFHMIMFTISDKGFIKHSMEVESIKSKQCSNSLIPGVYEFGFEDSAYKPRINEIIAPEDKFKLTLQFSCNGVFSYILSSTPYVEGYVHTFNAWILLLPPVQLVKYDFEYESKTIAIKRNYPHNTYETINLNTNSFLILKLDSKYFSVKAGMKID